ncbi:MAG TPA: FAD-binding oxidoreductase [Chromatiales bacterium]|nr:FAD-binding oxidoreductase [Chromatiales bacterium]
MSANLLDLNNIIDQLVQALGAEHVLTDPADREFYSTDVYNHRETPLAVVQPGGIEDLRAVARIASAAGVALVARGGGASYTDGYLPTTANSLLVDTGRMNRILTINAEDMYVTVEPGVTWAELTATLAKQGLRTPFWGPFSGLKATIGGSMSQNAASLGSGNYGISADSVLSFEIVLPSGEVLRTSSQAIDNGTPFFRWFGPDLTGLFTGDAGILGIKASITLRLIPNPEFTATASFGFNEFYSMAGAMAAAARTGVVADCFGVDPTLQKGQLSKTSNKDAIQAVWAVLKTSTNPVDGLMRTAKMAIAGKNFLGGFDYSMHYVVEGSSRAEVNAKLAQIRKAVGSQGTEVANTIPTVLRAMPFIPLYPVLGPRGQRWVPMHGLLPFSKVREFHDGIYAVYDEYAERMKQHKVEKAAMFTTIGTNAQLYEPVFYWEDERTIFHKRYLPQEYLDTLPEYPPNPEGRALVQEMKGRIQDVFSSVGAVHMQLGKSYPYLRGRQPEAERVIRDIKKSLDPDGLMNPGGLGL